MKLDMNKCYKCTFQFFLVALIFVAFVLILGKYISPFLGKSYFAVKTLKEIDPNQIKSIRFFSNYYSTGHSPFCIQTDKEFIRSFCGTFLESEIYDVGHDMHLKEGAFEIMFEGKTKFFRWYTTENFKDGVVVNMIGSYSKRKFIRNLGRAAVPGLDRFLLNIEKNSTGRRDGN